MPSLYAKTPEELVQILALEQKFRGSQIYSWLIKGVTDFEKMSNLSAKDREHLKTLYPSCISSKLVKTQKDKSATKLLIELEDGALVECVMLTDGQDRKTACLSTQVGCAMGCTFCKTGTMGLVRNLEDYEIVEQMIHLRTLADDITHIVFMGMGEPLANFGPLMRSIQFFHDPKGFNISHRRMTVSTCGLVPGIRKLTEVKIPVRLAVSLVSADNETRDRIMKVNKSYPLKDLKGALIGFQRVSDKRITLEYCLLKGVNTSRDSALKLSRFTEGLFCVVNLIPWNPIPELGYETPDDREIRAFCNDLDDFRVNYTIRLTKGRNVSAACGQLATESRRKGR